jgi:hypothetical protein
METKEMSIRVLNERAFAGFVREHGADTSDAELAWVRRASEVASVPLVPSILVAIRDVLRHADLHAGAPSVAFFRVQLALLRRDRRLCRSERVTAAEPASPLDRDLQRMALSAIDAAEREPWPADC